MLVNSDDVYQFARGVIPIIGSMAFTNKSFEIDYFTDDGFVTTHAKEFNITNFGYGIQS